MKIKLEQVLPKNIEKRSFEIIQEELKAMGKELDPRLAPVIMRAIHTTADFDYADQLFFSQGAMERGLSALKQGAHIVTDTRMAWSGVNKKRLATLGGEARCFMADEDVALQATLQGTTRAAASMDKAASIYGSQGESRHIPCILAVGNAPTALVRLRELMEEGIFFPALIIGVPVGFVNVVAAKELIIEQSQVPCIVARGRKGGSNVAAAICNALLYQLP